MTTPADPLVVIHASKQAVSDAAGARILLTLGDAQAARGQAHVVLTGGELGSAVLASAGSSSLRDLVDWMNVHVWWGDERFLPAGDSERNDTQNRAALLDSLPLDPAKVHPVAGPERAATPDEAARQYAIELAAAAPSGQDVPEFDLLLLGVGPDGHVCSLFPRHPALDVVDRPVVGVIGSPKPPPLRVTLTFPTLARARHTCFLVAGEDKAEAVAAAVGGAPASQTPAAAARGRESTRWLIDAAASWRLPARRAGAVT